MRPRFLGLMVVGIALWFGLSALGSGSWWTAPVQAQENSPEAIALQVYKQLPWLSKENQYQRQDNGAVAEDNTLVSRFIRYHTQNKTRSPLFRLDWKLTLANYLGIDDYMLVETYPGANFLKPNPMESDRKLIQGLNRKQRDTLIQAIVDVYDPVEEGRASTPTPATTPSAAPSVTSGTSPAPSKRASDLLTPQPQTTATEDDLPKGDARLLLP